MAKLSIKTKTRQTGTRKFCLIVSVCKKSLVKGRICALTAKGIKENKAWHSMMCFFQHTIFIKIFFYNLICYFRDFLFQILALIMLPTSFIKPQGFCEHVVVPSDLCCNYFLLKSFNYCDILHWGIPSSPVTSPNKLLPQSYYDT